MGILRATAVAAAALLVAGATTAVGMRVAGEPKPRSDAPVATTTEPRRPEPLDLGRAALALMPDTFRLHGRQNTLERTCFVGDGARVEPCSEFTIDGPGVAGDRRRALRERATQLGWRIVAFDHAPEGPTLRLVRGNLRARVVFGPAGVTPDALASNSIRVWDPARRRSIDEPVEAEPQSDDASRQPFVAAANAACDRFSRRMSAFTANAKPTRDEMVEVYGREWQRLVDDLSRLEPHRDHAPAVAELLRELRRFGAVLRLLAHAEGEDALPAVAGLLHQGQRAEAALAQFGLTRCRGFTGAPPRRS